MRYLTYKCVAAALTSLALIACSPASEPLQQQSQQQSEQAPADAAQAQLRTLYVAAEYDDDTFRLHYRIAVETPSWYHQYWRFHNGEWVRMGSGADGPDEHGLYEDRISMMLDDGSVEGFRRYGGWMLINPGMRSLDSAASAEEVRAHPILGEQMGRSDVRKFIPQSRTTDRYTNPASWQDVKPLEEIAAMQERGEFLDLWQWRAHRSNPIGYADNTYVLHYRLSSEGRGMYTDNQANELQQPAFMFYKEKTGLTALSWDALINREYSQDDWYYLNEENAVPFAAEHEWQEGDVLPFRLLREPNGPRGAIRANGNYADGYWRVTLERSLASPNPLDSKALQPGEIYYVAFAVHQGGVGARHHDVSLPHSLGLAVDADIVAHYSEQPMQENDLQWHAVHIINPGQVDWHWLTSQHPGAGLIRGNVELGVQQHHDYLPLFQRYIERHEAELSKE